MLFPPTLKGGTLLCAGFFLLCTSIAQAGEWTVHYTIGTIAANSTIPSSFVWSIAGINDGESTPYSDDGSFNWEDVVYAEDPDPNIMHFLVSPFSHETSAQTASIANAGSYQAVLTYQPDNSSDTPPSSVTVKETVWVMAGGFAIENQNHQPLIEDSYTITVSDSFNDTPTDGYFGDPDYKVISEEHENSFNPVWNTTSSTWTMTLPWRYFSASFSGDGTIPLTEMDQSFLFDSGVTYKAEVE